MVQRTAFAPEFNRTIAFYYNDLERILVTWWVRGQWQRLFVCAGLTCAQLTDTNRERGALDERKRTTASIVVLLLD